MNKAQKRLVSALAAASSVAAVIAPAATVFAATKDEAAKLVAEAKKTLAFVDYNAAYAAVVALPEADQATLLAELSPLWEKVATADIMDVLKQMESMAKTWDLDNYYKVEKIINETVKLERNQQYLMGELTSWGKKAVFTADVVAATDAIIKAWTDKTPASIAAAKEAAAKVTNAGSLAWLNTEIESINKTVPVAVSSVTATTAKTFVVKFNKAVEDTTKVAFEVKKLTTVATVTVAWNDAKTEATLSSAANFAEGTYSVAVKNDTTDLGSKEVSVSAQKVAKIEVTSTKLAVSTKDSKGYATYKVFDQYGNNITDTYLANSITFQSGVGSVAGKNGVLTVTPNTGINLITFSTVVITAYESTNGVSTSASLATSTATGTLNGIELKGLKNADGKVLTAGDNTTVFYLDYTALDMSDNETKDLKIVTDGLFGLTVSAPTYVTAAIVEDPLDANKAAIEVKATTTEIQMDLPISIIAMTNTGKTSTINLTLKKQATLDTFTLMAPAFDIAKGEIKEVPFVAYDQNGTQLTKFSDLDGEVSFPSGYAELKENVDGTAKVLVGPFAAKGVTMVSAVTKTGKMSTLSLNIQDDVKADALTVDTTKIANLQIGATQKYDFHDAKGLTVKDQYGRDMDLRTLEKNGYKVTARAVGSAVTVAGYAQAANQIVVTGANAGSGSVVFELIAVAKPTEVIASKSVTFTTVANDDIKGYVLDAVTAPIYASADETATTITAITARQKEYKANPKLYGTTSSGAKVKLADKLIIRASVDNTEDFVIDNDFSTGAGAFDAVKVYANGLKDNATSASTNLTVTFNTVVDKDGKSTIKSLTTPITSSTAKPVAATINTTVKTEVGGLSVDNDVVTVDLNKIASTGLAADKYLVKFLPEATANTANIYFTAKDQYGKEAMKFSYIGTSSAKNLTAAELTIDSDGKISAFDAAAMSGNEEITVTAVTTNGLSKALKIKFVK